ncbi:hypothetical protein LTR78_010700 [Recurvomyces mirabilis]|uniref:Luciferase domain-containing protein n=1 Tax=Recurvomyces mirabilis TaxID=574656 RepID=A0AAE0TMH7_9PEZI|nr:hypothetical protein LTR78_010700 [Recurvomyces mirabilis]KAK5158251.1 hypothetical protein LTS14_003269 [Recurvomyces mirabilis]
MSTSFTHLVRLPYELWTNLPIWTKATICLTIPTTIFLSGWFMNTYRKWSAMGQGGLPRNVFGFALDRFLWFFVASGDLRSQEIYDRPEALGRGWAAASGDEKTRARTSFLGDGGLEKRKGAGGRTLPYAFPQRERFAREWQVPKVKEAYVSAFQRLCAESKDTQVRTPSRKRHGDALFLRNTAATPAVASASKGEIAHIHTSDLSAHVVLSLADAKEVVAKGWGQRHSLSGTSILPLGWTMLYVPRTVEEVDVMIGIMRAAVGFMRSNVGREKAR